MIHDVLLSNELKHTERIAVPYIEGLCAYCLASDESAARLAGAQLVYAFHMRAGGVRFTVMP